MERQELVITQLEDMIPTTFVGLTTLSSTGTSIPSTVLLPMKEGYPHVVELRNSQIVDMDSVDGSQNYLQSLLACDAAEVIEDEAPTQGSTGSALKRRRLFGKQNAASMYVLPCVTAENCSKLPTVMPAWKLVKTARNRYACAVAKARVTGAKF